MTGADGFGMGARVLVSRPTQCFLSRSSAWAEHRCLASSVPRRRPREGGIDVSIGVAKRLTQVESCHSQVANDFGNDEMK